MLKCEVRSATIRDNIELQDIYTHLNPDDPEVNREAFTEQLQKLLVDEHADILVGELDGIIVSSCTTYLLKNLSRGMRPFVLVENVVVHCDYRRMGFGRSVLNHATKVAREAGC